MITISQGVDNKCPEGEPDAFLPMFGGKRCPGPSRGGPSAPPRENTVQNLFFGPGYHLRTSGASGGIRSHLVSSESVVIGPILNLFDLLLSMFDLFVHLCLSYGLTYVVQLLI